MYNFLQLTSTLPFRSTLCYCSGRSISYHKPWEKQWHFSPSARWRQCRYILQCGPESHSLLWACLTAPGSSTASSCEEWCESLLSHLQRSVMREKGHMTKSKWVSACQIRKTAKWCIMEDVWRWHVYFASVSCQHIWPLWTAIRGWRIPQSRKLGIYWEIRKGQTTLCSHMRSIKKEKAGTLTRACPEWVQLNSMPTLSSVLAVQLSTRRSPTDSLTCAGVRVRS